jgi:hypothetical protein
MHVLYEKDGVSVLDTLILGAICSFTWPVTGLYKSVFNYPDIRHDRWRFFLLSLAGLIVLALALLTFGWAHTGQRLWWWLGFGLTAWGFYMLTLFRLFLHVSQTRT